MSDNVGDTRKGIHAEIYGRVQGVAFRYYTRNNARRLGITGWAKNRPDGSVEVHAEGPPAAIDTFASWLREGPPAARVTRIDIRRLSRLQGYSAFTVE